MRRFVITLAERLSYANVAATVAVFVALGGGAYAAISSIPDRGGVFHGCVDRKTGALRVVASAKSCRKARTVRRHRKRVVIPGELAIAWNRQGQKGDPCPATVAACQGPRGPQGPGATSFFTPASSGDNPTFATLPNDLTLSGGCGSGVRVKIATTGGGGVFISGTGSTDGTLQAVHVDGTGPFWQQPGSNDVDLDVVARGVSGTLDRIDVHGTISGSACTFWGMITPSS